MGVRRRTFLLPCLAGLLLFLWVGHWSVPAPRPAAHDHPGPHQHPLAESSEHLNPHPQPVDFPPAPPAHIPQPPAEAEAPLSPPLSPSPAALPPSQAHASLSSGHWRPSPLSTEAELHSRWGPYGHWCLPAYREDFDTLSQSEKEELGRERLYACAGWEWVPDLALEGGMRDWSVMAFTERMVNSERGMLVVGDSLTGQMADVLYSMLLLPIPGLESSQQAFIPETHYSTGMHTVVDHMSLTLNPFHPLYAALRSRLPNVPEDRFARPVVEYIRNDLLLSFDELDPIFQRAGFEHAPYEYGPYTSSFPWLDHLPTSSERWQGEEDTVLILNTGAHWSRARWGVWADQYAPAYRALVRHLLPLLMGTPKLHTIYRGIASPHTRCYTHSSPTFPGTQVEKEWENDWGWSSFPLLDQIWQEELDSLAPSGLNAPAASEAGKAVGAKVDYLDVREMTAQRPEDHMLGWDGKGDCLHWCGPTVPGTWVRMVWHILGEE